MATALSVYATCTDLGGTWGAAYGFSVSQYGLGYSTFNIGNSGAGFDVADNSILTVMDILLRADARAVNGTLYAGNTMLRKMANDVFDAVNTMGSIG